MKIIYKLFLLALSVYTFSAAQIADITRLSVQNPSQSLIEPLPAWLSENEILIFYINDFITSKKMVLIK